jgi:hypothetical protein
VKEKLNDGSFIERNRVNKAFINMKNVEDCLEKFETTLVQTEIDCENLDINGDNNNYDPSYNPEGHQIPSNKWNPVRITVIVSALALILNLLQCYLFWSNLFVLRKNEIKKLLNYPKVHLL